MATHVPDLHMYVQAEVPYLLTVTVPDQSKADWFHSAAASPPVMLPESSSELATRAEAAAMAMTAALHAGTFVDMPSLTFGPAIQNSQLSFPTVLGVNMSVVFPEASSRFQAVTSAAMDTRVIVAEAMVESAAYELQVAVRDLPTLTGLENVCYY